jgi:hypothetical protein
MRRICRYGLHATIQTTGGRRLKTAAAAREIPIHPDLLRIGLCEFVTSLGSDATLLPGLNPSRADGVKGDPLGKWFQRYRLALDKKPAGEAAPVRQGEGLFRLPAFLHRRAYGARGVLLDKIKPLTGHEETSITFTHYAPAFSLRQKAEVVDLLKVDLDLSHLHGRMPDLIRIYCKTRERDNARTRYRRRRHANRAESMRDAAD